MADKDDGPKLDPNKSPVSARKAKKLLYLSEFLSKQESRINCKKVSKILKKSDQDHTEDEKATLAKHQDIVKRISKNKEKRKLNQQRVLETEDSKEDLQKKCEKLAKILQQSKKTVIYTGAGISTAASIPDYRGPQGVWTLLQKGEQLTPQDLSDAEPTLTHMCITQLHKLGHVKHVVSQNCDGLHMRSGLPRQALSEVHGNMFVEICYTCRPHREYVRLFDVTENTGVRRHFTGRHCQKCGGKLKDTIVHFGEKGGVKSPYRWKEAVRAANKCDLILCLGSSLKILKKYACLWCMDRVKHKRPKMVIVNLQWTPKDESATLKINGKCDDVMEKVMQILKYSLPDYSRKDDPIFGLATSLTEKESDTTTKKVLEVPNFIPRLRSHGISRTPTPSDFSDSQSSVSSTDSSETPQPRSHSTSNFSFRNCNFTTADIVKRDCKNETKSTAVSSETLCLSRSERICNEAKIAMQERLVNAKINEMYGVCSSMQSGAFCDKSMGYNGLISPGQMPVEKQRKIQYDPLQGGPFDPGPSSHDEKVKYLQVLQSQLEDLKMKQRLLKDQEHHCKQQKGTCIRHLTLGSVKEEKNSKQLSREQVSPKILKPDLIKLETDLKKERTDAAQGQILSSPKHKSIPRGHIFTKIKENQSSPPKLENCQKNKTSPNNALKFNVSDMLKTSDHSPAISGLEKKLQQNLLEQTQLQTILTSMQTNQQQLEEQVKVQHQNEHLRLHQHFLIQEQQRRQLKIGKERKEEILRLFLQQQQSLLAQQSAAMQCLQTNYFNEVQKVQKALQDLRHSYTSNTRLVENMKAEARCARLKHDVGESNIGNSPVKLEKNEAISVVVKKMETSPVSQELQSPKKDHSIASILHGSSSQASPNRSSTVALCGAGSSLKGQPQKCESCHLPNGYGTGISCCAKCEQSRQVEEGQSLAKPCNDRVLRTFLKHENVSELQSTRDKTAVKESQKDQDGLKGYNTDSQTAKAHQTEKLKNTRQKFEHNDHNYLKTSYVSTDTASEKDATTSADKLENITIGNDKLIEKLEKETIVVEVSTSSNCTVTSKNDNKKDDYKSRGEEIMSDSKRTLADKATNATIDSKSKIENSEKIGVDCQKVESVRKDCTSSIMKPPEKVTFVLNIDCEEDNSSDQVEDPAADSELTEKNTSGHKPFRSHSQSEIYAVKSADDLLCIPVAARQGRSHSHSEVDCAEVEIETESDSAKSNTDKDGEESGSAVDKDSSGKKGNTGKKRKLVRCLSVPGWFGKGLNIKKRRRY